MNYFHVFVHIGGRAIQQLDELLKYFWLSHPLAGLIELVQHAFLQGRRLVVTRCWPLPFVLISCSIMVNRMCWPDTIWRCRAIIVVQGEIGPLARVVGDVVTVSGAPLGLMTKSMPYMLHLEVSFAKLAAKALL